ncbi:hypothetical protein BHE74_00038135 [Ensete ventricosum]|nr:hypothetical protein BHE74_00038135 [Ensete ventricosum]
MSSYAHYVGSEAPRWHMTWLLIVVAGVAPEYALSFFPPPPQEACLGFLKERLEAWLGSFASWVCDPVGCVGSPAVIPIRARWPASILLVYRCEPLVRLGFVKKRKRRKKEEEKKEYLARASSSPTRCCRPLVAPACDCFFSRARKRSVSLRGEKDRGDNHLGPESGDGLYWVGAAVIGLQRWEAEVEGNWLVLDLLDEGGSYQGAFPELFL